MLTNRIARYLSASRPATNGSEGSAGFVACPPCVLAGLSADQAAAVRELYRQARGELAAPVWSPFAFAESLN